MTTCDSIFGEFKDKVTDYDLLSIQEDMQDEILLSLLNNACRKFGRICKSNLKDRDEEGNFNVDLDSDEIDIITEWMVEGWLKQYKNNSDLFSSGISTSDFKQSSPANLLEKINTVYEDSRKLANSLTSKYSHVHGNLKNLKPR